MSNFTIDDIDHIEVFVKDRDNAAKWYGEIFGLNPIDELSMWEKIGPLFIGNKDRTVKLALINGTKDTDGSINRMAFSTSGEKFIDFLNHLNNVELFLLGNRVTKEKMMIDHDASYSIYFDDPDGNKLELTCYDHDYVKSKL